MRFAPQRPVSRCEPHPFRQILFAALVLCSLTALSLAAHAVQARNSPAPLVPTMGLQ
jgi:hypothetical protein